MRRLFRANQYDYALNLFTSFGYFTSEIDDIKAIQAMAGSLRPNGLIVLDYLNTDLALEQLDEQCVQELTFDGIHFTIEKAENDGFIEKRITLDDKGTTHNFMERVKALKLADFKRYLEQAGLTLDATFGSYELDPFNVSASERLILVAQKTGK
jgi:SAM-dependent methyltransferase